MALFSRDNSETIIEETGYDLRTNPEKLRDTSVASPASRVHRVFAWIVRSQSHFSQPRS